MSRQQPYTKLWHSQAGEPSGLASTALPELEVLLIPQALPLMMAVRCACLRQAPASYE